MINGMTIDGKAVKKILVDGKLWWANAPATIVFADPEVERVLLTTQALIDFVDGNNLGSLGYVDRNGDGKISFDEAASCGSLLENEGSISSIFLNNAKMTSFTELKWFKGLRTLDRLFNGCVALKTVELPVPSANITTNLGSYVFRLCYALRTVIIPEGWEELGTYIFYQCTKINLIDIPSTCNTIGAYFLSGSMSAGSPHTTIVCRAEIPPTFGGYGTNIQPLAVYVPDQSVQSYKSASGWNAYPNAIKPLSTYIE